MASKLKDFFDQQIIRAIADDLHAVDRDFDQDAFVRACLVGLESLELTQRAWHVAAVMHQHLPAAFPEASRILTASLGPELPSTDTFGMAPFRYLPHVFYVAKHGLGDFEDAMALQYALTKSFSAEFSIRGFLEAYPDDCY